MFYFQSGILVNKKARQGRVESCFRLRQTKEFKMLFAVFMLISSILIGNQATLRCRGKDDFCCTIGAPCEIGDGDCDFDAQCKGDLRCGSNNCVGPDFDATDDCCAPLAKLSYQDAIKVIKPKRKP